MRTALKCSVPLPVRVAVSLALALTCARGATLELLSLNDLIGKSTYIVQGQVTGTSASYTGSVIYTHYKISVSQQWKGSGQSSLDVLVPGGTANGVRQTFAGAPQLVAGRQYVLFLWKSSKGLVYTMGFTQGVFNLGQDSSGNTTVSQMPATETMLAPGTGQVVNPTPTSMPLTQLVAAINAGLN